MIIIYYSKEFKGHSQIWCSSENCMGMSKMNILLPSTNWYCKTTSNSTRFWHDIQCFFFKLSTLRPKRNAIFTENDPISEASGWQSSAVRSKNCIARESPIFPEYSSTIGANRWAFMAAFRTAFLPCPQDYELHEIRQWPFNSFE